MIRIISTRQLALIAGGLLFCQPLQLIWADADDKPAGDTSESAVKRNANGEMVVTVDAATQKRIKIAVASPTAATWLPTMKGYGRVADPTPLVAAVVDLATARLNAEASGKELRRLKTLAAQDNASARSLEAAELAADHDRLSVQALQTRLMGDWGPALAGRKDLAELARLLSERKSSLVRLFLPAGETLSEPPAATALTVFPDDTRLIPAELIELNLGVDSQTEGQTLLLLVKDRGLPWGAAVTGHLSLSGQPLNGVEIPAAAVLRHEGRGWVYLQTANTEFTRHEIPLDRLTQNGWFVTGDLTTTNQVVTAGAETILSAELSSGGFNTGTRD